MQNEFVEKGAHYTAYPASLEIIPKIERRVKFARKHSMAVIWTQCGHRFPGAGILLKKAPQIAKLQVL